MAQYSVLVGNGSQKRVNQAGDVALFNGDILVMGNVVVRGGVEVDSLETLMPLNTDGVGTGGEALRFDTGTAATVGQQIRNGGYVQHGGKVWNAAGAVSIFGSGMRMTPKIDAIDGAGVPTLYHWEIGSRTGVEKWRIDQDGYVTMLGTLDSRNLILVNPAASAVGLTYTTQTAATAIDPIRNPGYTQWTGQCWTGFVNVVAPFMSEHGIIDTQAAGVPATYHREIRDRLGTEVWRVNQVGTMRTMQMNLGATHAATAAAEVAGYQLRNDTLSTVPAPMQVSPSVVWHGSVWDDTGAGSPLAQDWRSYLRAYSQAGWRGSRWVVEENGHGAGAYYLAASADNYAYCASLGCGAMEAITTGMNNTCVGGMAGMAISAAHSNTCVGGLAGMAANTTAMLALGYSAGRYETGDYKVFIDNRDRGTEARGRVESLIYGVTDAAVLSQTLAINAVTTVNAPAIGAAQGTTPANEFVGVRLNNATLSVAGPGVTSQVSGSLVWHGSAFNSVSGLSETHDWRAYVLPATAAGATDSSLIFGSSLNGAAYTTVARLFSGSGPSWGSVWFGANAGTVGLYTVSIGASAGSSSAGRNNCSIGDTAGGASAGDYNVSVGADAGRTSAGSYNISIGESAGRINPGSNNVAIGRCAGYTNSAGGSNSIFLGYYAGKYSGAASNQIYIDSFDRTSLALGKTNSLIYGVTNAVVANQTLALNAAVTCAVSLSVTGRIRGQQGADVTAANDTALSLGNYFDITGATQINGIAVANWTAGSMVTLQFDSNPVVKHNTAASAGYASILLAGAGDFASSAGDTLTLVYDGTTWREVARSVI